MDERQGDRHKNRAINYASGASKKRKAKEQLVKVEKVIATSTIISDFMSVTPKLLPSTSSAAEEEAEIVVETERESDGDSTAPEEQVDAAEKEETTATEGSSGGIDISLWPVIIPGNMQQYRLKAGSSTLQHCDEELFSLHSEKQQRKDGYNQRICTLGLFRRRIHNGEVVTRNWRSSTSNETVM